jgi:adenylate kinase family enzyme
MTRVLVVGTTCAGKTTLSQSLSNLLHLPHVEFDSLFWDPNWSYTPDPEMRKRLEKSTAGPQWILDGNFLWFKDIVWDRADTLVWLDYPMPIAFWRAVKRTYKRCLTHEQLWQGNVESWSRTLFSRDSVPLWAIRSWRLRRRDYSKLVESPASQHMHIYRIRSPHEADLWLSQLSQTRHGATGLRPAA